MRQIKFLVSSLLIVFSTGAFAGTLIEPYLGYQLDAHRHGVTFGGRIGYRMLGASAGIDYQTGRWRDDHSPSNSLTPSNLGVFVGYTLPILLRAYLVYSPIARLTAEHGGYNNTFDGGEAFKFGVGWTAFPLFNLNAEYVTTHYRGLNTDMYGVNISLPLGF